jgi:UPF0755 protein
MQTAKRLVASISLVALAAGGWFALCAHPLSPAGAPVAIRVVPGESVAEVANDMDRRGILANAWAFRLDTVIFGTPMIRDGYYLIPKGASHGAIRAILSRPPNAHVVTVFAGSTVRQIARQMATVKGELFAKAWQSVALGLPVGQFNAPNSEGLLGVGAYVIGDTETPKMLLASMQSRFVSQLSEVGLHPRDTVHGLSMYQFLTAASIVEKEGYYEKNMPKVARVILNRLARGGGLQMDATVLYFLDRDGVKVTPSMLRTKTPYNTYLYPGLTPTPISQIGPVALQAMKDPPKGPWLYFVVVDQSGTEAFAETYAEHVRNIELARSRGL